MLLVPYGYLLRRPIFITFTVLIIRACQTSSPLSSLWWKTKLTLSGALLASWTGWPPTLSLTRFVSNAFSQMSTFSLQGGMKRQLEELCHILKYVDPVFYSYLDAKVILWSLILILWHKTPSPVWFSLSRNLATCISASAGCSSGSRGSSVSPIPAPCGRLSGQRCEFSSV